MASFYIASKFEERETARRLMDGLEALGHKITFDWTTEHYQTKEETKEDAQECLDGVFNADAFVGLFVEDYIYEGSLVEMGEALADDVPVYIVGHAIDSCLFTKLATGRFETMLEFLDFVKLNTGRVNDAESQ